MYETKAETDGYRGGFRRERSAGTQRAQACVFPQGRQGREDLEEGACTWLQPRTGGVETLAGDDTDILADWPLPMRAAAYVFTLLCFMGIVPMALATALGCVIDVLNCAWVLPVGVAAVCVYGYRRCGL